MRKIGIITLYGDFNYGNKLQSYATQYILRGNYSVCTIRNCYKVKSFINYLKMIVKNIIRFNIKNIIRKRNFKSFNNNFMNYTSKIYNGANPDFTYLDQYDNLIVGSDQVWNCTQGGINPLMLASNKKLNNVSFAASFGVSKLPEKYKTMFKQNLENFKNISVREEAGKKIVEELTGRNDVEVLVDPTMLLNKREWKQISKKPKNMIKEKYILSYFLGELSVDIKTEIYNLANKNGWKVINILDKKDTFYVSGPSEFIYLEENAELICTDSFHSCVFGILMDTPFMVFNREDKHMSMNSRLETLLTKFKLEDRYYNGTLDKTHLNCNYSHCQKILEYERKKSNDFIKNALETEEG